jgi:hypothetical protein
MIEIQSDNKRCYGLRTLIGKKVIATKILKAHNSEQQLKKFLSWYLQLHILLHFLQRTHQNDI